MCEVGNTVEHERTTDHSKDDESEGEILEFARTSRSLDTLLDVSVDRPA